MFAMFQSLLADDCQLMLLFPMLIPLADACSNLLLNSYR
jgi:hypothetical protein